MRTNARKEIDHGAASLVDDTPWYLYDTNSIRDITAFTFLGMRE